MQSPSRQVQDKLSQIVEVAVELVLGMTDQRVALANGRQQELQL